jgi:Zn-dependent peptidase ImmA (M78 family)
MAGLDSNRGAKRAREAREALDLDPAAPIACLLTVVEECAELPVVVARLPEDVAGACYRAEGGAVLWVNGAQARPRQRFTLAHELGHAWCKHDGALEVDSLATLSGKTTNPLEVQANAFAAELLVPRAAMQELVAQEPTLDEVVTIAAAYGVSAVVVVYRLKQLRLVSEQRVTQLQAEIDDGLHEDAFERLALQPIDDRLGSIEQLPYLSAALEQTYLGAALRRQAPADAAVAAAIDRLLI